MPLLTLDRACLAFGHVALLDHTALQIDAGERIGLIGRNGSGKSSLLKALCGMGALDDGVLWTEPGLKVSYVPQEPEFAAGSSVFDAVSEGLGEVSRLLRDYHHVVVRVGAGDTASMDADMEILHVLQEQLEAQDGWRLTQRVEQMLTRLSLDGEVDVSTLSGGNKKRVALAQALVAAPDLLLLDEPTNHLDVDGIVWLEELLNGHPGAAVVITHDRTFLDAVATRIVELDRGELRSYPGKFFAYQERKEFQLNEEALANARADKLLAQEEVWIRKGVEARRTRAVGRIKRLEELRSARMARREQQGKVDFRLARGDESGKLVAELENVSKAFGERKIVSHLSCRIQRGDKIGMIGPNGCGKTTLLRLILGELEPDAGEVRLGTKLEVAYFDQFRTQLDPDATLAEVISPGSEYVEFRGARQHVIGYLGDFLFAPERARSPVKSLSGGERNRLLLARLFAKPANLLVLDEPTNDLDIETLELLEALLQDYPGTVFLVSHDRAFLDNVVTQSIVSEGQGRWKEYVGGYADWVRQRVSVSAVTAASAAKSPVGAGTTPLKAVVPHKSKLSFKEQRELDELPEKIAALELEQKALHTRFSDPAFFQGQGEAVRTVQTRLTAVEREIETAMSRWEALEAKVVQPS
ncbi:MAG: ATP-binding cassette domain-containing protein [Rhodocyclaceae bacterium]|nr:ATP-binding cassette domain-containing protein [Rhodocyclaceae bacterium]MBP7079739.1 ATP-binding cassette domain-containing protein [Rhodocyclaceae bacterium]